MPDNTPGIVTFLANWGDLLFFIFFALHICLGGVLPRRRLWGSSLIRRIALVTVIVSAIVFFTIRLILEGIYQTAPLRGLFATGVVAFIASWVWNWNFLHYGQRASRLFEIALALREIRTFRYGNSSDELRKSKGLELVVRRGARKAKGDPYWRGFIEGEPEFLEACRAYIIHLVEVGLHQDKLSAFGDPAYLRSHSFNTTNQYKRIYDVIMTVEVSNAVLKVPFENFIDKFNASSISIAGLATEAEATGESNLAKVARRVAADAVGYVSNPFFKKPRTKEHVACINECIDAAVEELRQMQNPLPLSPAPPPSSDTSAPVTNSSTLSSAADDNV